MERKRSPLPRLVLAAVLAASITVLALALVRVGAVPAVKIEPGAAGIGRLTPVNVHLEAGTRGLAGVKVELVQNGTTTTLAEIQDTPRPFWAFWGNATPTRLLELKVGKETVPSLVSGEAMLRVTTARAGTWLRHPEPTVTELTLPVRLTPPALTVLSAQNNVVQGGSEVVVYRVGGGATKSGVSAGAWFFPGYPLPGGDAEDRFALYSVPFDQNDTSKVRLMAEDEVGNVAERVFIDRFTPRPPTEATIQISDAFLAKVVPEILGESPEIKDEGDPLKSYLAINRELRRINNSKLVELAATSKPSFLWNAPFRQLGNSAVMASFADHRAYVYNGATVDHQTHLGFDLASVKRAPVEAANRGIVVLASYFGIYGNTVVLDHGFGVMTLYSHLSSIGVTVGQEVEAGAELGRTGETGLAAGDHLHFSVLVHGLPVTPVEWWDAKWLRDHLKAKLGSALPFAG